MELNERTSVLEIKVENIEKKVDQLKQDFKEDTKEIKEQLSTMYEASCKQHAELGRQLRSLENKSYYVMGAIAIITPILMFIVTQVDWKALIK